MLYSEIIAVCSDVHTKLINALWLERRKGPSCARGEEMERAGDR
jgi:hypothetical protein